MILQQIKDAHLAARKARDQVKLTTLTTLIGEITSKAKIAGAEPTDKDCVKALTTFRDNAFANAKVFDDRGDDAKFEEARVEVILYESFLPAAKAQLSAEALTRVVRSVIASRIASAGEKPKMGTVIADVKLLHDGEYDPKALAPLVKAELEATADPKAA